LKVTILTAGSRGDVQPYVALGTGLRNAGFSVRLATHVGFQDFVESYGLEFAKVAHPAELLTADPRWNSLQHAGDTAGRFLHRTARIVRLIQPLVTAMLDDFWAACRDADAVLGSIAGIGGRQQAAALGVPHCWALVQPMSPTREYPHFMSPAQLRFPGRLNFRTHVVAERVYWRMFRKALDLWLAKNLGVAAQPRPAPGGLFGGGGGPIVYGMSPALVRPPRDWPPNIAQYGHWFLEAQTDETLPPEVERFLEAGPSPVFVHAARIGVSPPERFTAMVVRTLTDLGLRGLVSGASPDDPLPPSILALPPVPFDRLFPRVAGVVHHGGAGTTAMALRAGVPTFGVPGFFDQPFWSARVAALGAGPRPVPARRLTEPRLRAAVAQLAGDRSLRECAQAAARRLRSERGVDNTVEHLHALLAAPEPEALRV
jgi:sterol 3beta-glucosyltransferase